MESDNLQSDHVQKKELACGDLVDGYGFDNVILSIFPLLQDLKPAISYLPPQELELVHNALKVSSWHKFKNFWQFIPPPLSVFKEKPSVWANAYMWVWLFQLAFEAHDGQKRRSGEPFIIHPVEVARILGELVSYGNFGNTFLFVT